MYKIAEICKIKGFKTQYLTCKRGRLLRNVRFLTAYNIEDSQ